MSTDDSKRNDFVAQPSDNWASLQTLRRIPQDTDHQVQPGSYLKGFMDDRWRPFKPSGSPSRSGSAYWS